MNNSTRGIQTQNSNRRTTVLEAYKPRTQTHEQQYYRHTNPELKLTNNSTRGIQTQNSNSRTTVLEAYKPRTQTHEQQY